MIPSSPAAFAPLQEFLADKSWHGATVAHRGAWQGTAENSVAAVERAIALGVAFAEIDVQESRDGQLFCLHDMSLMRTAGLPVMPAALDWATLGTVRLRKGAGGPDAAFSDQTLPLFDQILETARGRIYLDIDAKSPVLLPAIAKAVRRHGMSDAVNVKLWATGPSEIAALRAHLADLGLIAKPICFVGAGASDAVAGLLADVGAPMVEAFFEDWPQAEAFGARMMAAGRDIFVNTLDQIASTGLTDSHALQDADAVWGRLMRAGMRLMQTDLPEALQEHLGQTSLPAAAPAH